MPLAAPAHPPAAVPAPVPASASPTSAAAPAAAAAPLPSSPSAAYCPYFCFHSCSCCPCLLLPAPPLGSFPFRLLLQFPHPLLALLLCLAKCGSQLKLIKKFSCAQRLPLQIAGAILKWCRSSFARFVRPRAATRAGGAAGAAATTSHLKATLTKCQNVKKRDFTLLAKG